MTRLKALASIQRLRDIELKARSRELASLQQEGDRLSATRARIADMRRAECSVREPAAMPYTAGFLARLQREDLRLERDQAQVEQLTQHKRDEVLDHWRGVKAVKMVAASIEEGMARDVERKDRSAADEHGLRAYGRQRAAAGA